MRRAGGVRLAATLAVVVAVFVAVLAGPASDPVVGAPEVGPDDRLLDPDLYPTRDFDDVKGLQPDFWPDPAGLTGLGTVAVNFQQLEWEPTPVPPPCPANRIEFDGRCYTVPASVEQAVKTYTDLGVHVTAVTYGTPAWARGDRPCNPPSPGFAIFCVPDDPDDYARFVGMLAARYNGANGHGRIVDFVIQNEVNMNMWFNVGCGSGIPCDLDSWVADYAELYNRAYDRARAAQPRARVMFSFTHHFEPSMDEPDIAHPAYSIKTFLPRLVPLVGEREWSIALHPYPNNLAAGLDARDLPHATLGNLGVVPGWLRATYPDDPHAWEIQLTEVGIHNPPELYETASRSLCQAFRNVLGTPGITSFIYHRLRDHPDEFFLRLGLVDFDDNPKPAFAVWLNANDPESPDCGFELRGRTVVRHGIEPRSGAHWFSSRVLPVGYVAGPEAWELAWAEQPGTRLLYECGDAAETATWLWAEADCAGARPMGPVGWIAAEPGDGLTGLYACIGTGVVDRIATTARRCRSGQVRTLLGYVEGSPTPDPVDPPVPPQPPAPPDPPPATPVIAPPHLTG